ncbi:MAG: hypothetical protein IAF94_13735 [Pirellulaceae bacterium]|nr:hypothetical protein [Pirellulaceae bacterium]
MNRSFHAFAVLLVSLAGGMIAATWTSTLPTRRPTRHASADSLAASTRLHCSCNPENLVRFEQGCARDKTTGELYGCGLGLGKNGTSGKSVLGAVANSAVGSVAKAAVAIREGIAGLRWQEFATQSRRLETELAALHARIPSTEIQPEIHPDDTHEQDYAAAELAAAGFDPSGGWLSLHVRLAPLHRAISADAMSRSTSSTVVLLGSFSRKWDRQSRLWLVENGLHRPWDDAEAATRDEQRLASARLQIEEENFDRWFENFPPPTTQPNRLMNPVEPKEDPEDSRRIILATAKALETISSLLHQTAENLARHAEQDVAELHKLKSGIEERR